MSPKSSTGLAENSFDDRALTFSLKSQKSKVLSLKFQNRQKKVTRFSLIQNLHECLIWTRKKKFWKTFSNSSGNSELLQPKPKMFKKDYEFLKKLHLWKTSLNGQVTWTFDKPAEVWKPKNECFNLKVRIDEERFIFFQNIEISVKFFLRTERIQFRYSCQQFKAKVTLFFRSKAEKFEEKSKLSRQRGFSSRFSWT